VHLCTGCMAHRGSRGIALLFHDCGTRRRWEVSVTPWPLFAPRKDLVPIVQEAGWAPGLVWTGVENLTPTRIWSPDRPDHSQLLYQLRYPAHNLQLCSLINHLTYNFYCKISVISTLCFTCSLCLWPSLAKRCGKNIKLMVVST
jgi:hypothetical protein